MAHNRELSSPLDLLHRASQVADKLFVSHVGAPGLTPRQFAVLKAVGDADGLSQTDIMMATGIDRSSTAELVGRLVTMGLLARRRYQNRCTPLCCAAYANRTKGARCRRPGRTRSGSSVARPYPYKRPRSVFESPRLACSLRACQRDRPWEGRSPAPSLATNPPNLRDC